MRKVLGWVVLAFVVFYVITDPSGAADAARGIGSGLSSVGAGLGEFVTSLLGGGR